MRPLIPGDRPGSAIRRRAAAVGLLLCAASASMASLPTRAADTGKIVGRVVNGTTGEPQGGVEVTLTRGRADRRTEDTVITGTTGRYAFEDLTTGEGTFYVLDANYKEGLFAGRPLSIPSNTRKQPVIRTRLRVFEPTTDPASVLIRRDDLFVVHDEDRISVIEAIKVVNPTDRAYVGRGSALAEGDDDGVTPSLGFALPDRTIAGSFRWLDSDLDVPQAVDVPGVGFGITSAIPPGEIDFMFTYQVEGSGGTFDISRRALYEIAELSVFAADPLVVTSNRLEAGGEVQLDGTTYDRSSSSSPLEAADPIQILVVADAGPSWGLMGGAAGGVLGLILIAYAAARRPKRGRRTKTENGTDRTAPHRDLVTAIAQLDLRHEAGDVSDDDYERQRAELKAAAAATPSEPVA